MRKKIGFSVLIIFCLCLYFNLVYCQSKALNEENPSFLNLTENEKKSLQSLRKVDDTPFYVMTYYGDYGFEEFLKTGISERTDRLRNFFKVIKDGWKCSCFAAYGDKNNPVFGRNFDWVHRPSMLLFTDPPNGYASVSMIDIFYCGYESEVPMSNLENRAGLLEAPYMPFDGMNEMGIAVGTMAVPYVDVPPDNPVSTA